MTTSRKTTIFYQIISLLLVLFCVGGGILTSAKNLSAYSTTPTATIGELWNSKYSKFNSNNLKALKNKLGSLYTSVSSTQSYDSQAISKQATSGTSGLIVKLGGLTWVATYLSQSNTKTDGTNKDVILTLWLTDSAQLANATYTNSTSTDVSQVSNFNSGKFTDKGSATWAGWYSYSTENISPSNMYGTSFMRSVVLNNGGKFSYAKSADSVSSTTLIDYDNTNSGSIFAPFTTGKLANYIVTPNQVSWQSTYNSTLKNISRNRYNWTCDCPNELLDITTSYKWYSLTVPWITPNVSYNMNYTEKEGYTAWGNDKLWLPSIAETGNSDDSTNTRGLWDTTTGIRNNTADSWMRSGNWSLSYYACSIDSSGSRNGSYGDVKNSLAVRPALHLNLTSSFSSSAAETITTPTLSQKENEFEYDGGAYYIDKIDGRSGADEANFLNYAENSDKISISGTTSASNPGVYTIVFSITNPDEYIFENGEMTAEYTWKIIKRVTVPTLTKTSLPYTGSTQYIDSGGSTSGTTGNLKNYDSIYVSYSGASATNVGSNTITFTLKNPEYCTWNDKTTTAKTASWSIVLAKPTLKQTSFEYNGSVWYIASASNTDSGTSNFENYNDQVGYYEYSDLSATDAGTYCVVFYIKDGGTWADGTTAPVLCKWTITAVQTYSITLNFERDTNSEETAVAFATITKVDKDGNSLDKDWSEILDTKNPTITVTHLADGYYSIKVTASTNHVATIGNIRYGTSTNDLILNVIVVQNNYGGFYANSTSHTTLTNTKVNGVVSVLSLSGGEVKTISSGLTTITEYNIKNIALLSSLTTLLITLPIVNIIYKRKNKITYKLFR